ncbi:hypothetical protein [Williamsia sp.]
MRGELVHQISPRHAEILYVLSRVPADRSRLLPHSTSAVIDAARGASDGE